MYRNVSSLKFKKGFDTQKSITISLHLNDKNGDGFIVVDDIESIHIKKEDFNNVSVYFREISLSFYIYLDKMKISKYCQLNIFLKTDLMFFLNEFIKTEILEKRKITLQ